MKSIRNDYCIRMFADSGNNLRPYMNEINLDENGYLYASDAHIIGKINAALCLKKYKKIEKYPNAESLILEHESSGKKTVTVEALFNDLMKIECCFKPKMIDCDECDGTGTQVCQECEAESDCRECTGTGKVPGDELELTSEHNCDLFNRRYKLKRLDIIIKTAVILNVDKIEISNGKTETSATIFTVGNFTVLIMPLRKKI